MLAFKLWFIRTIGGALIALSLALTFRWRALRRLLGVNALFSPKRIVGNFSNMSALFFHQPMTVAAATPTPLPPDPRPLPERFTFRGASIRLDDWIKARAVTAMVVLKDGRLVHEAYLQGTQAEDLRISWSMAKSFLSAAVGIAVEAGEIASLEDEVTRYAPALKGSAYEGATIRQVLNMSSGVSFNEDYLDYHADINRMGRVLALGGSMDAFAAGLKGRDRAPGRLRKYVSIDTHVIGMVLRGATGQAASAYLAQRLLEPMRLEADAYYLTDGDGVDFVLGGLNLRTRDYARFGLLFAQGGRLGARQIVPEAWVEASTQNNAPPPIPEVAATDEGRLGYGYQWWLPPEAAPGEFFAIGVYGQYIYVHRPRGVVIALNSADRGFKEGEGRVTLMNLEAMRAIAEGLAASEG
ncbi:beta-lactamase family protein [Myxococcota bacterium]|nr:beta-lactamase family protein [Myxococcota bacterium]MBU1431746.1 beta-lactamase family protein [Myxococcota bacterium]MBU1898502.1 beta-lactamase family protein [Myxococcota bacterium]